MRQGAKLPDDLSPEIFRAAVYLLNRAPKYQFDWKSPLERFKAKMGEQPEDTKRVLKPHQGHLKVYGCKAFALTPDYMKGRNKLKRCNPKAWLRAGLRPNKELRIFVGYSPPIYNCLRHSDGKMVAQVLTRYDQFLLEYIPNDSDTKWTKMAFHIRRNKFNSSTARRPSYTDARKWHLRLGHPGPHPGPLTLGHLVNSSQGVRIRGIKTVECEACGTSKASRQIRREKREIIPEPKGRRRFWSMHSPQTWVFWVTSNENVEVCSSIKAIKYIHKYLYKGS